MADRRGFFRDLLRGAVQAAEALKVESEDLAARLPTYESGHETLPAGPAERFASVEELRTLCSELGREAWGDEAAALARTSFRLTPGGDGTSRLGGAPDVPPGFEWPVWEGEELAFLGQVRLDGLPASPLPAAGTLLFFFALRSAPAGLRPSEGPACRVVHVPPGPTERAERRRLREVPVVASAELTLPPESRALDLDWSETDRWGELRERLAAHQGVELEDAAADYHALHRLLGYPDSLVEGMELDAQLLAHGLDLSEGEQYLDPRLEELESGAAEWRLLFQLSSDDRLAVSFGYYERLFVWIRDADLRAGRFDDVRAFLR